MKAWTKTLLILLASLLLLSVACLPCLAAGDGGGTGSAFADGLIEIEDGILTDSQITGLRSAARVAARNVGANVGVIFTKSGLSQSKLKARADSLYDTNCDNRSDAIILAVDISSREYYIRQIGRMNDELRNSAMNRIESMTVSGLSDSNWMSAASAFISAVGTLDADDFGSGNGGGTALLVGELFVAVIALGIGFAVAGILVYRMNNARRGRNAANYVRDNSFVLEKNSDLYLYSTVTKVRVQTQSSSGGSSRGGSSRGGRGGKF